MQIEGTMVIDPPLSEDPADWEAFLAEMEKYPDDNDAKLYAEMAREMLAELTKAE